MEPSYRVIHPGDRRVLLTTSPEAVRDFLDQHAVWPPGSYELHPVSSFLLAAPSLGLWGVAVKHPDGSVELIPVRPD
jgi:hypothetical protein